MNIIFNKKGAVISQASLGTIFAKSKKGIGPVVAVALLLVVSVGAVMGFQTWFQTYQSGVNSNVEIQSQNSNDLKILDLIGNTLYIQNSNSINKTINSVKIGNIDCNFSNQNISTGVTQINITNCLKNQTNSIADIVVFSKNNIIEKKKYLKNVVITSNNVVVAPLPIPRNGLVAEYLFENSSNLGQDTSGNGNDGINNGVTSISGKIGNASYFNGSNIIDINIYLSGNHSISLWVNIWDYCNSSAGQSILSPQSNGNQRHYLRITELGLIQNINSATTHIPLNVWTNIIITKTGVSGQSLVYINGNFEGVMDIYDRLTMDNLRFGRDANYDYTKSNLDNLRIYNRTLNSTEIQALSQEGN